MEQLLFGAYRTGHEAGFIGCRIVVGSLPGYAGGCPVYFLYLTFQTVVCHRYGVGIETIRLDDVGSGFEVGTVYLVDEVWCGETEQIVVPF